MSDPVTVSPATSPESEDLVSIPRRLIERVAFDTKGLIVGRSSAQGCLILSVSDLLQAAELPGVAGSKGMRDYFDRDLR